MCCEVTATLTRNEAAFADWEFLGTRNESACASVAGQPRPIIVFSVLTQHCWRILTTNPLVVFDLACKTTLSADCRWSLFLSVDFKDWIPNRVLCFARSPCQYPPLFTQKVSKRRLQFGLSHFLSSYAPQSCNCFRSASDTRILRTVCVVACRNVFLASFFILSGRRNLFTVRTDRVCPLEAVQFAFDVWCTRFGTRIQFDNFWGVGI